MKIKIEDIKATLHNEGWELITPTYTNLKTEMEFKCPEGHTVYSTWEKMRDKRKCPICEGNYYKTQIEEDIVLPKKKNTTRVLALDQATYDTGWSIYDNNELVKFGIFHIDGADAIERTNTLNHWLISKIENWKPDIVGLEGIQYQPQQGRTIGVTTFKILANLQGVLMDTIYEKGLGLVVVHTGVWRKYCGVKGRTRTDKKKSMQLLAKEWYDVSVSNDAADAIGIGKYVAEVESKNIIKKDDKENLEITMWV